MLVPQSEELELLRRSAAEFVDREIQPNVRLWEQAGEVPRELFRKLADLGYLGVSEPDAGSDVAALHTTALRDGDDYIINGSKLYITNGTIADHITTAVRTGGHGHRGISVIVVPGDTPGLVRRRLQKIGTHASDTAELFFDNCRVPAENLVGVENDGFRLVMSGYEGERLVLAVIAYCQARLMFEEARRWGHDRQAFGQSILNFQVWQQRPGPPTFLSIPRVNQE